MFCINNLLSHSLLVIVTLMTISACSSYDRFPGQNKARAADELEREIPMLGVSITCVQHSEKEYIHSFSVKEPFSPRMVGGGNCGGLVAGGYDLPRKWQQNMKVKVRWNRPIKGRDNWMEKYTTILPYEKPGVLYVHFFENDQVRVVSSAYAGALSPNHPIL